MTARRAVSMQRDDRGSKGVSLAHVRRGGALGRVRGARVIGVAGLVALASCATSSPDERRANTAGRVSGSVESFDYDVPLAIVPVAGARQNWALRASDPGREARARVRLAIGEGIPSEFNLQLAIERASGGCEIQPGDVRLEGAETSAAPVVSARLDAETLALRAHSPGSATITVRGTYAPRIGDCRATSERASIALRVEVSVLDVPRRTTQRVVGCGAAPWMIGRSGRVPLEADFAAEDGSAMRFHNVRVAGGFRLRSNVPLPEWRFDAAQGLLLPRRRAKLSLVPRGGGSAIEIEWAVAPSEIDRFDVSFFVPGSAGAEVVLADGMTVDGSHRKMRGVFARVALGVGASTICDGFDPSALEIESTTPAVCQRRRNVQGQGDATRSPNVVPQAIRFERDGQCGVQLRGAAFDHGRGLVRGIRATFTSVDQFVDFAPES